jgi:hypothetical protein
VSEHPEPFDIFRGMYEGTMACQVVDVHSVIEMYHDLPDGWFYDYDQKSDTLILWYNR